MNSYPESQTGHSTLVDNFAKCWQIFKILSPLDSVVNLKQRTKYPTTSQTGRYITLWKLRRLATANRSCVGIRVTKIFAKGQWRGWPTKILPQYSLITMQNLIIVSHTKCTHVEGPKKSFTRWYPVPLGQTARLTIRNTPVHHLSYHAKIWRTRPNCMGVNRGPIKFQVHWASTPWDGSCLTPINSRPSLTTVTTANLVILGQTVGA